MTALGTVIPLALPDEERVVRARRSLNDATAALAAPAAQTLPAAYDCAWFGSSALVDRGSFALVDPALALADYVGDDLRLTTPDGRQAYVYVVGSTAIGAPIAVARRVFLSLGRLSLATVSVIAEVLA